MTAPKMETAAQKYRRIKEERLKTIELHPFTSPSGMEWKLRKIDKGVFITSGMLPTALAEKVTVAMNKNGGDSVAAMASLDIKDQMRSIEFMSKVVRYCAVEPRIVENITDPDIEIGFDDVEMDDYTAIFQWAIHGGDAADGLDTFRGE